MQVGYKLCSEEAAPRDLVTFARMAEDSGFTFAMISDHFHPWTDTQGQSPFVWSVLGGISQTTEKLLLGTAVTCPTQRIHPAIIAQAAATTAALMPGRFMLGVGSGENLNEHIFGDRWPPTDVRLEMLEEAVEVIRLLWSGEEQSFYGTYYTVEDARIYSLPDELPPILVAGSGPKSAELAGRIGDGFISTSPKKEIIDEYRSGGGKDKLCYGELTMCWAQSEEQAKKTALKYWPTAGLAGELTQELRVPAHFEQASSMVTEEDIAKDVVCGPDPDRVLEKIEEYSKAGFDRVWLHQIGPEQEGFFRFCEKEILPQVKQSAARVAGKSK